MCIRDRDKSSNHLIFGDNAKATWGNSGVDLTLYHDSASTTDRIDSGNKLEIRANASIDLSNEDGSSTYAFFNEGGSSDLYYSNSKKFETTNDGTVTTGIATATTLDVGDKILHTGDTDTAIRFPSADTITAETGGTERLRVASNGRIGIATEVPEALLDIEGGEVYYHSGTGNAFGVKLSYSNGNSTGIIDSYGNHDLELRTNNAARFVLDTSGNLQTKTTTQNAHVGLTTTSNAINLTLGSTKGTAPRIYLYGTGNGQSEAGNIFMGAGTGGLLQLRSAEDIRFEVNSDSTTAEAARMDSSGRLMVGTTGTTIAGLNAYLQVEGLSGETGAISVTRNSNDGGGPYLMFGKARGTSDNSETIVSAGDRIGTLLFNPADGGDKAHTTAQIAVEIDGTPGANDLPGRIIFATTADGANTVTEALRLDSSQNATFAGSVSDSKGDLRRIIYQNKTSGYTLVAADAGKAIHISTGGVTINNSIFSAGDAVTIINNSGSSQTITQGSGVTLYDTGDDGSTGNKTLKARGMATVWFSSASVGYISGNF